MTGGMSNVQWEDDHMCFACGSENPAGLHLTFSAHGEKGLRSEFTPQKIYQGYRDIVHGGFIGLLLDEIMVNVPGGAKTGPWYPRKSRSACTVRHPLG